MRCKHKPVAASFDGQGQNSDIIFRQVEAIFSPHGPHDKDNGTERQIWVPPGAADQCAVPRLSMFGLSVTNKWVLSYLLQSTN